MNTIWKRDPQKKFCIIPGSLAIPESYATAQWRITEKIDGTNIRIVWDGQLRFFGRQAKSEIPPVLKKALHQIFDDKIPLFHDIFQNELTILFGEGFGGKISGGSIAGQKYRSHSGFILFDIWTKKSWYSWEDLNSVAEKLSLPLVGSYGLLTLEEAVDLVKTKMRQGKIPSFFGDFCPEGIVATIEPLEVFETGFPVKWKLKVKDYK